jgi:acylpyruvate hydrolase
MKKITFTNGSQSVIGKIVCVGRNYAEHAKELGNEVPENPLIFLKPASSVIFSGDEIKYPLYSEEMHHEVELVLYISGEGKDLSESEAEEIIGGYGVGLDMTLRDIQTKLKLNGHPWTIAKCFDTSAVLSEFVSKDDYNLTMNEEITLRVNDEVRQKDKLNRMLFNPARLVCYISSLMTLEEGDLIMTGTPAGVGKVKQGDKLFGEISEISHLEVSVA